jgi:hypothetical protein
MIIVDDSQSANITKVFSLETFHHTVPTLCHIQRNIDSSQSLAAGLLKLKERC